MCEFGVRITAPINCCKPKNKNKNLEPLIEAYGSSDRAGDFLMDAWQEFIINSYLKPI